MKEASQWKKETVLKGRKLQFCFIHRQILQIPLKNVLPETQQQNFKKLVWAGGRGGNYLVPKSTFIFQRRSTKFSYEDALQDPEMFI